MSWRDDLSWEEFSELIDAHRKRFREGEIDEDGFRRLMAKAGYKATEIDVEVEENKP